MKKSKPQPAPISPVQTQSFQTSEEERQRQQNELNAANETVGQQKEALSSFLPGSARMSQFRQGLTNNLAHSTAVTGENALARIRERAQAAGFGGSQPITFGAEAGLANEQAGRIAGIPLQVEQTAIPIEQQAISQLGNVEGQQQRIASTYNPEYYYGEGGRLAEQNQQDYYNQLAEARKRKAGIWGSLAKIGTTALGAIPGLGTVGQVAGAIGGAL